MKSNQKVSIIIPVYNIAKYLKECLDSILAQTYPHFEILLIDDGSTDQSPQICDRYVEKDPRIKVIHKQNGGAASARNKGLDIATGDFVCFIDSDDSVKRNYIERLLDSLEVNEADISVCAYQYLYKNVIEHESMDYIGVISEKDFILRFLSDWKSGLLWNKIFRASLIDNIRFEEGHKIDDEFFTYQIIMNAQKIVVIDEELYIYRMRASSVMQSKGANYEKMLQDRFEYLTKRYFDVIEKYPDLKQDYLENLIDNYIRLINDSRSSSAFFEHMKLQIGEYKDIVKGIGVDFFLKRAFRKALKSKYEPLKIDVERKNDKIFFE
ncbi:hypothetical protein BHF70_05895 [Anaerostipes sp. 494a]|uniref:glycosyltransferase family 2 protein n=1 Tax=Anaerostipes sp. 494a TaxID=1261636 RepID=UPI0009532E7D|nr:glycosyltransferase [Anaerostipes sp. 494a]OLR59196.1 hypothetical protein BHF70_05895 [Anaerostipes sp. 494a]